MRKKHISKRNKFDAGKIATIFLVAMLALAGAGIAYSMWTQNLSIIGTVSSGEVKIGLYDYGTRDEGPSVSEGGALYPNDIDPGVYDVTLHGTPDQNHLPGQNLDGKNIASHNSYTEGEYQFTKVINDVSYDFKDQVREVVNGVYPWYQSGTIVYVGNGGTIPVKISDVSYRYISGNENLLNYLVIIGWTVEEYSTQDGWNTINTGDTIEALESTLRCFQLEPCHTLSIEIDFYFIEEYEEVIMPQGESLTFAFDITAAQWNEVDCDDTPPFCVPNLEITKTVDLLGNEYAYIDNNIQYTVTVTNNGDCEATNVLVNDLLPDGLTYNSHDPPEADYDYISGDWNIGSLSGYSSTSLDIVATVVGSGTSVAKTQLCLIIDGSSSIDEGEWDLMIEGITTSIRDPNIFPHDGSVELTVIQFSSGLPNDAVVEVGPIVVIDDPTELDPGHYENVALAIEGIIQDGGSTPLAAGIDKATETLLASPNNPANMGEYERQVINIVTDGAPNIPIGNGYGAAETARDNMLSTLHMISGEDEIDAEGIGISTENINWLRDDIVWPDGYKAPPFAGPGWVRDVEDFQEFKDTINEKFQLVLLLIENCATLTADHFDPAEVCIEIIPRLPPT